MAIKVTAVARLSGPSCDHIRITVDDEGTSRNWRTSFQELDALVPDAGIEAKKALISHWLAYRRRMGRAVLNVEIA